jgi:hypothetical protein
VPCTALRAEEWEIIEARAARRDLATDNEVEQVFGRYRSAWSSDMNAAHLPISMKFLRTSLRTIGRPQAVLLLKGTSNNDDFFVGLIAGAAGRVILAHSWS